MFYFDPLYLVLILPAVALSIWASMATRGRFVKWSRVANVRRISGAETARFVLDRAGLRDVQVQMAHGYLADHYDPRTRAVRLSPDVFSGRSVSAMAVAAHETGHAIQHQQRYAPLALRSIAVPLASFGGNFAWLAFFAGMLLHLSGLAWVGVFLFAAVVVFQLITLPVELDASSRAKTILAETQLAAPSEQQGVSQVLTAAALTYVAGALTSIMTLVYFVLRANSMGDRRRL